jgi:hypothetical protein
MSAAYDESLTVLSSSIKKNLMLEFSDASSLGTFKGAALRFKVVAYYPLQFAELRRRFVVGGELAFVLSLSRCKRWHPRGGKTTAYFAKTHDERFVVKQLSRPEKVRCLHRCHANVVCCIAGVQCTCIRAVCNRLEH